MSGTDLQSGKGHKDENFPVASFLIAPQYRAPVLAFYRFVRFADDIADHATAAPAEKLHLLEQMRATLEGESDASPEGMALRACLVERKLSPTHALDLLEAFRRDVTKLR
jgi:phytoene/squalene synthetase